MDREEQLKAFSDELEALLNRFGEEFDLNNAEVIGVLSLARARVIRNALDWEDEED